ncbi:MULTISPECIES: hypothetical protein [unclassified Nocardioides]|uniref:hypothetical protein n=1 Tax=unclassified Nocardioides TaxID=2615069 RepID=UPI000A2723C3|nr:MULTISPECIES: hypothetical protein [unclassified Nocardioides]
MAAGALIAPAAFVAATSAPADAATSHKHQVYIYKMEKDLRLAGVGPDAIGVTGPQSLSCNSGDTVIDGMWMVKHVDQFNPPPSDPDDDGFPTTTTLGGTYNDERDVYVKASYPDLSVGNGNRWLYDFANRAYGDAQLKLYVTCIRGFTESTNSHQHPINVTNSFTGTPGTGPQGWTGRTYWDSAGVWDCAANEYFVAPGFNLAPAGAVDHRLVASVPTNNGASWRWEFAANSLASVAFYGKCISNRVGIAGGHKHGLAMKHLPSSNFNLGHQYGIDMGDPSNVQFTCDEDVPSYHGYKAGVGWFYMADFWEYNWFLGMEPRPKTRVYRFFHDWPVDGQVKVGALCINSRTSNPLVGP